MSLEHIPQTSPEEERTVQVSRETIFSTPRIPVFREDEQAVHTEVDWLHKIIALRTQEVIHQTPPVSDLTTQIPVSDLTAMPGNYAAFVQENNLTYADRVLLALCIASFSDPLLLDTFLQANPHTKKLYREFGGRLNKEDGSFIPTLRTAVFLMTGTDRARFLQYYEYLLPEKNQLLRQHIVLLENPYRPNAQVFSKTIRLDGSYRNYFLFNHPLRFNGEADFPARLLTTTKTWEDLVLPQTTLDELQSAIEFVKVQRKLFRTPATVQKIKQGYVLLLHGPPGTGKTMTAAVIGQMLGIEVYVIDLSQVVSKYIGETEKNLEKIFNRLEDKECALLFDEADALLGKRSEITDAKDRYANQEVSYLLQRIEQCSHLVMLATNFPQNLDDAFKRRILSFVQIPQPDVAERLRLWQKALPERFEYESEAMCERMAKNYLLSGANIDNIIKLGCIRATDRGTNVLSFKLLEPFIRKEHAKEGKSYRYTR